jgi:hypothetical protein
MAGTRSDSRRATGVTVDAYAIALTAKNIRNLGYILRNTHAANGLHYKIDGYLHDSGFSVALKVETVLAALTTVDDTVPNLLAKWRDVPFSKIDVSVKASVGAAQAAYDLSLAGLADVP